MICLFLRICNYKGILSLMALHVKILYIFLGVGGEAMSMIWGYVLLRIILIVNFCSYSLSPTDHLNNRSDSVYAA